MIKSSNFVVMGKIETYIADEMTRQFVKEHACDDVRELALAGRRFPNVDMRWALVQISGRQRAAKKVPLWASLDDIVYPVQVSVEQSSSEWSAKYKSALRVGSSFVDLTGGMGVDFSYMSRGAAHGVYVERDAELCAIARHNFAVLGLHNVEVANAACEDYLLEMAHVDTIYLDPSRRDEHGRRVVSLADCRPNVVELLPLLRSKSSRIIIKLSPMLDHRLAAREVGNVSEIHIVSVGGECKELLLVLDKERAGGDCRVICVNDDERLEFAEGEEAQDVALWDGRAEGDGLYIYEPNASIMKAGATELLASKFSAMVVSKDSHLIVSGSALPHFPGRGFVLQGVSTMNKKEIKSNLAGITRANVSVRNFPMRADELSKRLKVTDGGEDYIFGTRLADGKSVLLFSRKI